MKQRWQALVQRLDALSVRERLILFVTVLVGMAAALDTLWLAPAQQAYRQLDGRCVMHCVLIRVGTTSIVPCVNN